MQTPNMVIGLVNNAALLLSLGLIYDVLSRRKNTKVVSYQLVSGFIVAAIAIALMATPVRWVSGIIFDTRTILLGLTGLFFGPLPTVIAMLISSGYRLALGGAGAPMGVATILVSGTCGLIWRHYRFQHQKVFSFQELIVFGLTVHAGMILCMLLLPQGIVLQTMATLALPVMVIYPVCTALLGSLLTRRHKRLLLEEELTESAQRYNHLADQSRTVTWEVDASGIYTYVSPIAESVFGYTPREMVGKMHVYDIDPETKHLIARREQFEELVASVRTVSGSHIWVSSNGLPMFDAAGNFSGYRGSHTDISERKHLQDRLQESELLHRTLFEQNPYGVVLIDPQTASLVEFNDQACRQLGYTREEFATLKINDIDVLESPEDTSRRMQRTTFQGSDEFETVHRAKNGEHRNVLVQTRYSPLEGRAIYHCIWRDITKEKKEEQLLRARTHLIEFSLSHDITELMAESLDQLESLTGSIVSFFHLLEEDQVALPLQAWSTRTSGTLCNAGFRNRHYDISQAGVWADCVLMRQPAIHNDYAALPHRKGLPPGHVPLIRELLVPVIRGDKIVAVLGVGNKNSDYTGEDLDIVVRFADLMWDIAERKQVQESLRESNERFRLAFDNTPLIISISDLDEGRFLDVNQCFLDLSGFTREEVIGNTSVGLGWLTESDRLMLKEMMQRQETIRDMELEVQPRTGPKLLCKYWGATITFGGKKRLLSIAMDITLHRKVEQQFMQAQKMETVGRLAGGVAHDFNNMLSIIIGQAELALMDIDQSNPLYHNLDEILEAANRSAEITRQLLAFSRQQTTIPKILDLNAMIAGMLKMLHRLIGEDIELLFSPGRELQKLRIDPTQLDQILVNLCVNARDAISGVGRIEIKTEHLPVDQSCCGHVNEAGFLLIEVRDNGCGIPREVIDHVFEPFFTTKGLGHGTGLGLATVYGIVEQSGGHISVKSEVDKGSVFSIHLPCVTGGIDAPTEAKPQPAGGTETVLLVEDEPAILNLAATVLSHLGYQVLPMNTPQAAELTARQYRGTIDLLITDVIMPGMNGAELAQRLQALHPEIKILLMSGYTADVLQGRSDMKHHLHFLQKPFNLNSLAEKVREALEDQP